METCMSLIIDKVLSLFINFKQLFEIHLARCIKQNTTVCLHMKHQVLNNVLCALDHNIVCPNIFIIRPSDFFSFLNTSDDKTTVLDDKKTRCFIGQTLKTKANSRTIFRNPSRCQHLMHKLLYNVY